jgi:hypothetical protein
MVTFAKAPDKDTVQAFFRTFRRRPVAQLFLFDALMMTRRDGKVEEKEKAVVDKIADQLEILKGTQQDIFDLFCHIKNRNWQESALYFSSHLLNPNHFKHLLAYHEIEFDTLMAETAEIRSNRLIEVIKHKLVDSLEWGTFACKGSSQKATKITKNPVTCSSIVSNGVSNEMILPWLQSQLERGFFRVNKKGVFINEAFIDESREIISCPDFGDQNYTLAEIIINIGDEINIGDRLYTLELDKTVQEVVASQAGIVESIMVEVGDSINKGSEVFILAQGDSTLKERALFNLNDTFFSYDQEANFFYFNDTKNAKKPVDLERLLDRYLEDNQLNQLNQLNYLLDFAGASGVALAHIGNLPTCDGVQVSAITSGHYFANQGHPNAINGIKGDQVEIRYCNHCSGGHGRQADICDDKDKRFTTITMSEMLTEHGFYLVK